ncbi:MAG: signal peptidase II [Micrococcales bacterium 70-64]|nr:signal peptidase II [Leifsonia sp.]ODU63841.1 MAG: signal peptidase II [Leifsonia sp. SCN 70-46]OJX85532.1 MAG: signal peptidase II [Micrococcales bacterium 70-64]
MTDAAPRRSHRLYALVIGLALLVILLDQGSKWWAESTLTVGKPVQIIGDLLRFQLIYNPGAAFSIGTGFTWIFTIVAAVAVVAIAIFAWRVTSRAWAVLLGLLLGGAATHFGDRMFRQPSLGQGHVVDFIGYGNLFIGNVADIVIVGCGVFGVILMARGVKFRAEPEPELATPEA